LLSSVPQRILGIFPGISLVYSKVLATLGTSRDFPEFSEEFPLLWIDEFLQKKKFWLGQDTLIDLGDIHSPGLGNLAISYSLLFSRCQHCNAGVE